MLPRIHSNTMRLWVPMLSAEQCNGKWPTGIMGQKLIYLQKTEVAIFTKSREKCL